MNHSHIGHKSHDIGPTVYSFRRVLVEVSKSKRQNQGASRALNQEFLTQGLFSRNSRSTVNPSREGHRSQDMSLTVYSFHGVLIEVSISKCQNQRVSRALEQDFRRLSKEFKEQNI